MTAANSWQETLSPPPDYAAVGPQDLVILAMKAHQVASVAADVPKLFGPHTVSDPDAERRSVLVLPRIRRRTYSGHRIDSVDPRGVIGANIPR
jgi:2-dehydropantoate 2-reductase